jgi:hypothetical protein
MSRATQTAEGQLNDFLFRSQVKQFKVSNTLILVVRCTTGQQAASVVSVTGYFKYFLPVGRVRSTKAKAAESAEVHQVLPRSATAKRKKEKKKEKFLVFEDLGRSFVRITLYYRKSL